MATPRLSAYPRTYKPELDILRFGAFLLVFVTHTMAHTVEHLTAHHVPLRIAQAFVSFAVGGRLGVDLFFLLSAYLITDLLIREKDRFGKLNVPAFYIRRALRIWPLYFSVIALITFVPFLEVQNSAFNRVNLLSFLFFVGNWSFVFGGRVYSSLGPLWSVSIEEQFYFLWPPIVARLKKKGILIAAGIMVFIANADRVIEIKVYHHWQGMMWGNTLVHLDTLAAGIAIAVILSGRTLFFSWPTRILMLACGLLLFALRGKAMAQGSTGVRELFGYWNVVIGCGLFLFAFLGAPIRSKGLEYLGKISYGLYVYHITALGLVDRVYPSHGNLHEVLRPLICLLLTVGISACSYQFLEKPFLKLKERFTFVESRPA